MPVVASITACPAEVRTRDEGAGQIYVTRNARVDDGDDHTGSIRHRPRRLHVETIKAPEGAPLRVIRPCGRHRPLEHTHLRLQFDSEHVFVGLLPPDLACGRPLRGLGDAVDYGSAILDAHGDQRRRLARSKVGKDLLRCGIDRRIGHVPVIHHLGRHRQRRGRRGTRRLRGCLIALGGCRRGEAYREDETGCRGDTDESEKGHATSVKVTPFGVTLCVSDIDHCHKRLQSSS